MINKDICNNLFDVIYEDYNINDFTINTQVSEAEKNVICKNFYFLFPFILEEMTKRQREILTLKYGYDKNQCEISEMLIISQSNVSIHLNAALKIVKKYYNIIYRATIFAFRYEKRKD